MFSKIVLLFLCCSVFSVLAPEAFAQTDVDPTAPPPSEVTAPADPTQFVQPKSRLRVKGTTPPNESSSFIGDPDNLDPLPPNRENIKDDSEPVLEDIRDVLNSQPPVTSSPAEPQGGTSVNGTVKADDLNSPNSTAGVTPESEQIQTGAGLVSDDPDLDLEKKFHKIYQRYNKNPTAEDAWQMANSKQTSREYIVQKGDTLWSISQVLFGDPNFWPKLWAVNKQGILNPHFINPGMKVYFYEGDENFSPTLSLGDRMGDNSLSTGDDLLSPSASEDSNIPRVKSLQPVSQSARVSLPPRLPVLNLPDSLPEGDNRRYRAAGSDVQVRLEFPPQPQGELIFKNDIIISDTQVKGDIETSGDMNDKNCRSSRVLKNVRVNEKFDEYDIFERIDGFKSSTGFKYAYRLIGTGELLRDKYFKIKNCNGFLHNAPVIVGKGKMREFATTKVSQLPEGQIMGGPDFGDQKYYTLLQYVFVDFGAQPYEVGQTFQTISNETEEVNSQFTVLEKFGSYAVVVITSISDVIEVGDRVSSIESASVSPPDSESELGLDEL